MPDMSEQKEIDEDVNLFLSLPTASEFTSKFDTLVSRTFGVLLGVKSSGSAYGRTTFAACKPWFQESLRSVATTSHFVPARNWNAYKWLESVLGHVHSDRKEFLCPAAFEQFIIDDMHDAYKKCQYLLFSKFFKVTDEYLLDCSGPSSLRCSIATILFLPEFHFKGPCQWYHEAISRKFSVG